MGRHQTIVVGTRTSQLALAQTAWVLEKLTECCQDVAFQLRPMTTQGDRERGTELSQMGGSGAFTRELERALADGEIDFAVHSYKDLPTETPEALTVAAVPERADPFDVLVLRRAGSLEELPAGAKVAAGSPRRREAMRCVRPDLQLVPVRGNIDTRLDKLAAGDFEALVMAKAALDRSGHTVRTVSLAEVMLPAPAQGALAVETRSSDGTLLELVQTVHDPEAGLETSAERRVLAGLGGGCHLPLGVLARVRSARFSLRAAVYAEGQAFPFSVDGAMGEAWRLTEELVGKIKDRFPEGLPVGQPPATER